MNIEHQMRSLSPWSCVRRWMFGVGCSTFLFFLAASADAASRVVIVTGAAGEEQYAAAFSKWSSNWQKACAAAGAKATVIDSTDKEALTHLHETLEAEPKATTDELWLVLLGHGSFDGKEGKFNLTGDDLSASDLAAWLKPFQRPVIVVCGFSASGAFLKPLSGPERVIITATKSGAESNYARFGGYFAEAIADPAADLDKDGQTSVLEAWLAAAQRVTDFYKNEDRLATEHSLLDDNGDGLGTPPDWFQGIRVVKKSTDHREPDGLRAHQIHLVPSEAERALPPAARAERDALERELAKLRDAKATLPEDEYYAKLEAILVRLAQLYREAGNVGSR